MTAIQTLLLSPDSLIFAMNVALASLAVGIIGNILARRRAWSLPARHGVLVAALVGCAAAPFLVVLGSHLSLGGIRIAVPVADSGAAAPNNDGAMTSTLTVQPVLPTSGKLPKPTFIAHEAIPSGAPIAETKSAALPENPAETVTTLVSESASRRTLPGIIGTLLVLLWGAGALVVCVRSVMSVIRIRRWIRSCVPCESPLIARALELAAHRSGIQRPPIAYRADALPAPVVVGLFRPKLAIPARLEQELSFEQLCAVLNHELAHIVRRDLWIGTLQQFVTILYWWNPLVWRISRQISDLREQICDDIAIHGLEAPNQYAGTLVVLAERAADSSAMPAALGMAFPPVSQLERRIRRILAEHKSGILRLRPRSWSGVVAALLAMATLVVLAQVQFEPSNEISGAEPDKANSEKTESKPALRPSLAELLKAFAEHERDHLPFHIKSMSTFRISEGLTAQQRSRLPWADGRKHQRLMENAQLKLGVWLTRETHIVDDKQQRPYEQYSDGKRVISVQTQELPGLKSPISVNFGNPAERPSPWAIGDALQAVFPLSWSGEGILFTDAVKRGTSQPTLEWDGDDAKLTFSYAPHTDKPRCVLWLSRSHDWFPVKFQTFSTSSGQEVLDSEWETTKLARENGVWRIKAGTIRVRDYEAPLTETKPQFAYSRDFVVLEAEYGNTITADRFQYHIPEGANVNDPASPEPEKPPEFTHEMLIHVVDLTGKPIAGAKVQTRLTYKLTYMGTDTTDESGNARVKLPKEDSCIEVSATSFRPGGCIVANSILDLQVDLAPVTTGSTVDENGAPLADVAIVSNPTYPLRFRADGIPQRLRNYVGDKSWADWSDASGQFQLTGQLSLRNNQQPVLLAAVDSVREKLAFEYVSPAELEQRHNLVLKPACHIRGVCLLEGVAGIADLDVSIADREGRTIAAVSPLCRAEGDKLRAEVKFYLPEGEYSLKSRGSSSASGFMVPLVVKSGQKELDFGTRNIPAQGVVALKGKPAPELAVMFHKGEETTLANLRGRVVVLAFWGYWCGPCVAGTPGFLDTAARYKNQPVEFLSIHDPSLKTVAELDEKLASLKVNAWDNREITINTTLDSADGENGVTAGKYHVGEWPTVIVIDQQGNVAGSAGKNSLPEIIDALLKNR